MQVNKALVVKARHCRPRTSSPPTLQRKQAQKAFHPPVAPTSATVICKRVDEIIFIRIIITFPYRRHPQ